LILFATQRQKSSQLIVSLLLNRNSLYVVKAEAEGIGPVKAYKGKIVSFVELKDRELEPSYYSGPVLITTSSQEADQRL
jgi:hypothetical protein